MVERIPPSDSGDHMANEYATKIKMMVDMITDDRVIRQTAFFAMLGHDQSYYEGVSESFLNGRGIKDVDLTKKQLRWAFFNLGCSRAEYLDQVRDAFGDEIYNDITTEHNAGGLDAFLDRAFADYEARRTDRDKSA